jgi:uncharacterized membrane protein
MNWERIGAWLFLVGVVIAFIIGFFGVPDGSTAKPPCREGYVTIVGQGKYVCVPGYVP